MINERPQRGTVLRFAFAGLSIKVIQISYDSLR